MMIDIYNNTKIFVLFHYNFFFDLEKIQKYI